MSEIQIVIPGDEPAQLDGSPHLNRLSTYGKVTLYRDRPETIDEKIARCREADIMINSRGSVKWPAEVLKQLPKLKLISLCGIGTDCIDLDAASVLGIRVCNIPGRTAGLVAEHALALLFGCARRLAQHTAELRAGNWIRRDLTFLRGKTLGVMGTGSIGLEMLRLSRAIGMRTIAWSFHPRPELAEQLGFEYVDREILIKTADAISLHMKLTPESHHAIGAREFSMMKPGCFLINTARGAIVETSSMIDALNSGHLGAAGFDVFDQEPLPPNHPLLSCERIVITPHAADQTPEGMDILNGGAVDNVIAFLNGTPVNVVNPG